MFFISASHILLLSSYSTACIIKKHASLLISSLQTCLDNTLPLFFCKVLLHQDSLLSPGAALSAEAAHLHSSSLHVIT